MNHYEWLEKYLPAIYKKLNLSYSSGIIVADGDKCYTYESIWKRNGIPFSHGVALYILTKESPYCKEVRDGNPVIGWVSPFVWVTENYHKFEKMIKEIEK
jgi:hypothetical protein